MLRALVQRLVRTSKRKYVNETLNKNRNSKEWWDTVKKLTNKAQQLHKSDHIIIEDNKLPNAEFLINYKP